MFLPLQYVCVFVYLCPCNMCVHYESVTYTIIFPFSVQCSAQLKVTDCLCKPGSLWRSWSLHFACVCLCVSLELRLYPSLSLSFISTSLLLLSSRSLTLVFSDLASVEEAAVLVLVKWPLSGQITPPPPHPIPFTYSTAVVNLDKSNAAL